MIHIRPESDRVGEGAPHAFIFPDGFLAFLNEGFHPVLLDLLLAVQAKLLLHLDLDRKAVGIPSGLPRDLLALHRMIARNRILDDTGQNMPDMRLAVGGRRAVIEHIGGASFPLLDTFVEDVVVFPEPDRLLLPIDEIHVRIDFFVHDWYLSSCFFF